MLEPGTVVDRYRIEAVVASGGMATVYRVRHIQLGSEHALKVLDLPNPALKERLLKEGQVQARLNHPNLVRVTDVVPVNDGFGLVMEFVNGPTLAQWIDETGALPADPAERLVRVAEAERIFRGILAAVSYAHRKGLVHRDLKPQNVLLEDNDGVLNPKVLDFGIAKLLQDQKASGLTLTGWGLGTPEYMAPEQLKAAKDVDARADIWALGCILYAMYAGKSPFAREDLLQTFTALGSGQHEPLETLHPSLPPRLGNAVRACLRVTRDERIADCAKLASLLTAELPPAEATEELRIVRPESTPAPSPQNTPIPAGTQAPEPEAPLPSCTERDAPPPPPGEPAFPPTSPPTPAPPGSDAQAGPLTWGEEGRRGASASAPREPLPIVGKVSLAPRSPAPEPPEEDPFAAPPEPSGLWLLYGGIPLVALCCAGVVAAVGYQATQKAPVAEKVWVEPPLPPSEPATQTAVAPAPATGTTRPPASGLMPSKAGAVQEVPTLPVLDDEPPSPLSPEPALAEPPLDAPQAMTDDALIKSMVRDVLTAHLDEADACYTSRLADSPNLSGTWRLELTVEPDGSADTVQVTPIEGSGDPALEACIAAAAARWRFTPILEPQTITRPYRFGPRPATPAPATPAPTTPAPEAPATTTPAPTTPAPAAPGPTAPAPAAPAPTTPAPTAPAPEAPATTTPAPAAPGPTAPAPAAPVPASLVIQGDATD